MPPTQTPASSRRFLPSSQAQASHSGRRNAPFFARSSAPSSSASPFPHSQRFEKKPGGNVRDEIDTGVDEDGSSPSLPMRAAPIPRSWSRIDRVEDDNDDEELDTPDQQILDPEVEQSTGPAYALTHSPSRKRRKLSRFVPEANDILDAPSSPSSIAQDVSEQQEHLNSPQSNTTSPIPAPAANIPSTAAPSSPSATSDDDDDNSSLLSLSPTPTATIPHHTIHNPPSRFRLPSHLPSISPSQPPQLPSHGRSTFLPPKPPAQLNPTPILPDAFTPSRRQKHRSLREYIPHGAADTVRKWILDLANVESMATTMNAVAPMADRGDEADARGASSGSREVSVERVRRDHDARFTLVEDGREGRWMLVGEQREVRRGDRVVLKGRASTWIVDLEMRRGVVVSEDVPGRIGEEGDGVQPWNVAALWDII